MSRLRKRDLHGLLREMGFDPGSIRAFDRAVQMARDTPGAAGVDIGQKWVGSEPADQIAVRLHVWRKRPVDELDDRERFPDEIDGTPTDVIEARYEPHDGDESGRGGRAMAQATVCPGLGISHAKGPAGTLGFLATESAPPNRLCLVSAAHVLFPSQFSRAGEPVVQPARSDGGAGPASTIGLLLKRDRATDSACAVAVGERGFDDLVFGSNARLRKAAVPRPGMVLHKSGLATGVTRGKVDGAGMLQNKVIISIRAFPGDGPLCDFSDSGAPWYDPETGAVVGIHSAGDARRAAAGVATLALQRLGLEL